MSSDRRRSVDATAGASAAAPPGGGWRYTLRVPSWSQAQLPDGDTAVFYQVEVTVLPPQGEPRRRSVGRRFSSFVTLYRRLREELGPGALRGLDPPPRRSLAGVNKKPELIEQRRWELEQWLWRLTESAQVANSVMMLHFCELDAAARVRPRAAAPPRALPGGTTPLDGCSLLGSPHGSLESSAAAAAAAGFRGPSSSAQHSPVHSYAPSWSGSEASDLCPDSSSSSLAAAAVAGVLANSPARHSHPARHSSTPPRQQQQQQQRQPSLHAHSDTQSEGSGRQQGQLAAAASLPMGVQGAAAAAGGPGQLRLALPVQQRGTVKAAVRLLRDQLATAQADLQDAARTIAGDQQAISQLAAEVQQLQEQQQLLLQGGEGNEAGPSEAAAAQQQATAELGSVKQQLVAAEAARDALQAQCTAQQRQLEDAQAELAALQQRLAEQEQRLAEQEQRLAEQEQPLAEQLQQQAEQARLERQEAARGVEQEGDVARQQLDALEARCGGLQEELQAARAAAVSAAADQEAAAVRSREDLKVLAKEVKSLRKQLTAAQAAQAAHVVTPAPPPEQQQQRDAELASLRQQLAEAQAAATAAQQLAAASASDSDAPVAAVLAAGAELRTLLAGCGISGSEAAALGATGVASRLASASQQLASLRAQVQQRLQQPEGANGSSGESPEGQLRALLAGLLLDAAAAKQHQHELLRSTLAVSAQLQGLEERVLSPTASPERRNTLPPHL